MSRIRFTRTQQSGLVVLLFLFASAIPGLSAANDKLVIAHYMTDMVPQTDRKLNRWLDPELADPKGSTAELGGLSQTVPMAALQLKNADLSEAVDFEIAAARKLGIDGFQFYYPLVDITPVLAKRYNQIIGEFLKQSESKHAGFKISLCLAHPSTAKQTTQAQRIALWSPSIRSLTEAHTDSSAWLRTADGSLLFYLWVGDALANGVDHLAQSPAQIRQVADAYKQLASAVGQSIEYVYQVRRKQIDQAYIDSVTEHFHAVWGWTASEEDVAFWNRLADRCHVNGCQYTQTVYADYYTSKVYAKGSAGHSILSTQQALDAEIDGIERHYRVTDLSKTQTQLLQQAIKRDASIINIATWNDYPEGHHFAPEVNHRFGNSILLHHFKRQWQTGSTVVPRDQAIVFYKRYRHDVVPKFNVPLKIKSHNKDVASEDQIELVTLLTAPANCFMNNQAMGKTPAGYHVHRIPSEPGPVRVKVVRANKTVIEFQSPVEITSAPLRTNRLTQSYSSDHETIRTALGWPES